MINGNLLSQRGQFYRVGPFFILVGVIHLKFFKKDSISLINNEVKKHRYKIVFDVYELVMLLGWTDQYPNGNHWVYYSLRKGVYTSPCRTSPEISKHSSSGFNYYCLGDIWQINTPPVEEILKEVKEKGIIIK